jgi:TonB-linked SusC/RagA family outer membrane protein
MLANGDTANMVFFTTYKEDSEGAKAAGFGWLEQPVDYSSESGSANSTRRNVYYETRMNYARTFGLHDVVGTLVFSRQEEVRGSNWPRKREDWIGRATYNYDRRYFLEVNGAYNGSEKFGPGYKFDLFPSIGGSWMISNEGFMKSASLDWWNILKVRYSWGLVGNDRVNAGGQWPYITIWEYDSDQIIFDQSYFGYPISEFDGYPSYVEGTPGNPTLRWETARKQNLGLDLGFFDSRVLVAVDAWTEYRFDMLIAANDRQSPPISGVPSNAAANLGEASSRGLELELTHRNTIGFDLHYFLKANWAIARSKVISKAEPLLTPAHLAAEGYPLNQTKSSMASGIIQSWDDLYSTVGSATGGQNNQRMPGDVVLIDYDADGAYESTDDVVPYGYPVYPQNNYSISLGADYKGIQLSVQFVGAYNVTRNISTSHFNSEKAFLPEFLRDMTWTYNKTDPTYPALSRGPKYNPAGHYGRFDGSFFRIQSAQLSYTIPSAISQKIGMERLEFYVNGRNLWLWSKMPDDGVGANHDLKNYPTKKQYNFGLRIQF